MGRPVCIGFEVGKWVNKPMSDYTNEELLEFYYKLRIVSPRGEVDRSDYGRKGLSTELLVVDMQNNIIDRMNGEIPPMDLHTIRDLVWSMDYPSPGNADQREFHGKMQKLLRVIDELFPNTEV